MRSFFVLLVALMPACIFAQQNSLHIIPYPKQLKLLDQHFVFDESVSIVSDSDAREADLFTAKELQQSLLKNWSRQVSLNNKTAKTIRLTRKGAPKHLGEEGYQLTISANSIQIKSPTEAGLFYGSQTLLQLINKTGDVVRATGAEITDWPDTKVRAMHYDTKHHQDTREYVEELLRDFAKYKVNMLLWEWEDKLAYKNNPDVGAPGAFTIEEMQEITRYARQRHIEIVPLVQGLGHASFILKWPQYVGAREIYASNFEFCPLKDSTYNILNSLWDEAINATPGSKYIHIGSDETYELGECSRCKKKAEEIGTSGLYHLFISRAAEYLQKSGRKIMAWESPMNWKQGKNATRNIVPHKGLVLTESYGFETKDLKYAREAKKLGHPIFAYDPNPGIEHLFLPYFFRKKDDKIVTGSLEESYQFLTSTLSQKVFDGVIRTSWDDSGLPMQAWMLQFIASAAYSWNASGPSLNEFTTSFFKNYFGEDEKDIARLFYLLNEGSFYYSSAFERWVWHEGAIGKTHLPDLPRGDALEYDPYWKIAYGKQIEQSELFSRKMDTASQIIKNNLLLDVNHKFDLEVFGTLVELIKHTALTYLDLASLEDAITNAHKQRFLSHDSTLYYLKQAESIAQRQLTRKTKVYENLVSIWEKTRLPKGLSTGDKKYLFRQDRTRHFANRTPDLRYLLVDEDDLRLEEYLVKLKTYRQQYENTFMKNGNETTEDPWNAEP